MTVLYRKYRNFLTDTYGVVSSFEHGIFGQSVFHSHIQLVPHNLLPKDVIAEGGDHYTQLPALSHLKNILRSDGGYLYFANNENDWIVDNRLTTPRFFRDRFAKALGYPERGNWKAMATNHDMMLWATTVKQKTLAKYRNSSTYGKNNS